MNNKKTALVLGGGGSRGAYEIGVWQALRELGIEIHIVTGTSVGALNGAIVVEGKFEEAVEMWKQLHNNMVFDVKLNDGYESSQNLPLNGFKVEDLKIYAKEIISKGGAEFSTLKNTLQKYIDESLIRSSPIEYGIVTVEQNTLQIKHLYKDDIPEGKILDYMLASSACYPALHNFEIDGVNYIDGGYGDNLPVDMAMNKGAERIIAVELNSIGIIKKIDKSEIKEYIGIKPNWDLGNFLKFDPKNSRHIMRLGYLDTMKAFQVYEGVLFSFIKGNIDKHHLETVEEAGKIFELSPEILYSKDVFEKELSKSIEEFKLTMEKEIKEFKESISNKSIFTALTKIIKSVNAKTLIIVLVELLKEEASNPKQGKIARPIKVLLKKEILVAQYLLKNNIITA